LDVHLLWLNLKLLCSGVGEYSYSYNHVQQPFVGKCGVRSQDVEPFVIDLAEVAKRCNNPSCLISHLAHDVVDDWCTTLIFLSCEGAPTLSDQLSYIGKFNGRYRTNFAFAVS
jgi:hypothetical protein